MYLASVHSPVPRRRPGKRCSHAGEGESVPNNGDFVGASILDASTYVVQPRARAGDYVLYLSAVGTVREAAIAGDAPPDPQHRSRRAATPSLVHLPVCKAASPPPQSPRPLVCQSSASYQHHRFKCRFRDYLSRRAAHCGSPRASFIGCSVSPFPHCALSSVRVPLAVGLQRA